jgi:hypothetical protein
VESLIKRICFCALVLLCSALPVFAFDFGLVISQTGEYTNADGGEINYTGSYTPWFSSELGTTANIYLSAKLSTVYENGDWKPENLPILLELGRFEISWRPLTNVYLEAGRVRFKDPAGLIAAGLFDGLSGSIVLGGARLSTGVFYTGLLYKETAKIMMNSGDAGKYATALDYSDPDTYFAPRRILVSAMAEFLDLTPRTTLALNILAQFDVNPESALNPSIQTQYFEVHYTAELLETLSATGSTVAALAEKEGENTQLHFAAAAGVDWEVPGAVRDLFHGELRWSSGYVNKNITAFAPLSSIAQGQVFDPRLSGLMILNAKYTARLHQTLSVSAEGNYFVRTDGKTLIGTEYPPSTSRLLGGELYATLLWAPVSDLVVTAGGGAFFPGWGDVFVSDAPVRWKFTAALILSL